MAKKTVYKPANAYNMDIKLPWPDRIRAMFGMEIQFQVRVANSFRGDDQRVVCDLQIEKFFPKYFLRRSVAVPQDAPSL